MNVNPFVRYILRLVMFMISLFFLYEFTALQECVKTELGIYLVMLITVLSGAGYIYLNNKKCDKEKEVS